MPIANKFIRVCRTLEDKGTLIAPNNLEKFINGDWDTDWYSSIYDYNQDQLKKFDDNGGSVAGITDVTTDRLVFDFDNKDDLNLARYDTIEAIARLQKFNITNVQIFFSGNKGFSLLAYLDREINPDQAVNIAVNKIGVGLKTLDKKIYNASRIFRVPGTKHQVSGLYKIQLSPSELEHLSIDEIRELAKESFQPGSVDKNTPSGELFVIDIEKKKKEYTFDVSTKNEQWRNCKWSLLQGNFGEEQGERHHALLIIAATCRGLGFDKVMTYHMCKSALEKQAVRTGRDKFSKEELWNNIIEESVFGDGWQGGQYTCSKDPWLHSYCESLGDQGCKDHEEESGPSVPHKKMWESLLLYAEEFEKNQIKTGLPSFDNNIVLSTSTLNGLLGQPGAGKTAFVTQLLKNASKSNIPSMIFEMDMGQDIYAAKLVQYETGFPYKEALDLIKSDREQAWALFEKVDPGIKNISFNYQSGLTVADIKRSIQEQNKLNGEGNQVRFVVIDYLECIAGPYGDATANSGFIANQLKDVANQLKVCILLLLQTQKHSTPDVSDPLMSLKGVKGSSLIEQSCSSIITLWREAYGPEWKNDDKYISFATVKNRFGQLWQGDFAWNGVKGETSEMAEEQVRSFKNFRDRKIERKKELAGQQSQKDKEWLT
jgi:hypothetical protein